MTEKEKEYLVESGFDQGIQLSRIHSECSEYQELIDEITKLMLELERRMFEHHDNCPKR